MHSKAALDVIVAQIVFREYVVQRGEGRSESCMSVSTLFDTSISLTKGTEVPPDSRLVDKSRGVRPNK